VVRKTCEISHDESDVLFVNVKFRPAPRTPEGGAAVHSAGAHDISKKITTQSPAYLLRTDSYSRPCQLTALNPVEDIKPKSALSGHKQPEE
jgi:hypothetical protein